MTQVRHRDKITDQTEEQFLAEHIFEHNGFHIEELGKKSLLVPIGAPIEKFTSTQEVAEKIKQFLDKQKSTPAKNL